MGPILLVGNKVDVLDREVQPQKINFRRKKNLPYFEISAKSNYNLDKPILWALRRLTGNEELDFTEAPALLPPDATVDLAQQHLNEQHIEQARNALLPDD